MMIPFVFDTKGCPLGDKAFTLLQYHKAIFEYEKCIKSGLQETKTIERLADSYRMLDNTVKSEYWYGVHIKGKAAKPKDYFWYGMMLLVNGKTEKCGRLTDSLLLKHPKEMAYLKLKKMLQSRFVEEKYDVSSALFNSALADYAPSICGDMVVFSSTGHKSTKNDGFTGQNYSSLCSYNFKTGKIDVIKDLFSSKYNIGSASFTADGQEIYFTANRKKPNRNGMASLMILMAKKQNGHWSEPKEFPYNKIDFNYAHPSINPKGDLLVFASDSYGNTGMDIYFCNRDKQKNWSVPVRMKTNINTPLNEVFPVFVNDSTIVFSSEGLPGLGGLDLFKTTCKRKKWSEPISLNAPFNSSKDDFGLTSTDNFNTGFFTSNRQSPEGNEHIYAFKRNTECVLTVGLFDIDKNIFINGQTFDITKDSFYQQKTISADHNGWAWDYPNPNTIISMSTYYHGTKIDTSFSMGICINDTLKVVVKASSGKEVVIGGKLFDLDTKGGISNEEIIFTDTLSKQVYTVQTNDDGIFSLSLPEGKYYRYDTKTEGSFGDTGFLDLTSDAPLPVPFLQFGLKKLKVNTVFTLKNIFYDFDKWDITEKAAVELERLISFLEDNVNISIELSSHTDSRGNDPYNMDLSSKRAKSAVEYLVLRGMDPERLVAKGYGETKPVNNCRNGIECTEDKHSENRRTEIKILSQ